jgi:hypothetical protein
MSRSRFTVGLDQHGEICAEVEDVGVFHLSVDEARQLSKDAHTAAERQWQLRYEAILARTTIEQVIANYMERQILPRSRGSHSSADHRFAGVTASSAACHTRIRPR